MFSRVGLVATALLVAGIAVSGLAARQPPVGTAMFVVRPDPRLCPSPRCGGYWVAIANGARTRCADGLRRPRCYVARVVDSRGGALGSLPDGSLVRAAIADGADGLDVLEATALYETAGTASVSGGYYRVLDTGVRCVRAPCFSFRAGQVNGSTGVTTSGVDVAASGASPFEIERAQRALRTRDGLLARGRFASTDDGGRVFRALRLYLRAPLPRA
jgi:uncharacterized protein DUF6748